MIIQMLSVNVFRPARVSGSSLLRRLAHASARAWPATMILPFLLIGCSPGDEQGLATRGEGQQTPAAAQEQAPAGTVLFVGTSLTAGYQLPEDEAFPARVQEKIDSAGLDFRVINAGVSGETSAGALRRLSWLLRQPFDVFVLETGANDMLRGTDLDSLRANIQTIVDRVRTERPAAEIVLVGMMAPPNLGAEYAERFREVYVELARENELPLVPFLLDGVGGVREMNLADGIHPNAEGQRRVAENVWPVLEPVLRAQDERAEGGAEIAR
jgi:acyl-CoA thioesterase I